MNNTGPSVWNAVSLLPASLGRVANLAIGEVIDRPSTDPSSSPTDASLVKVSYKGAQVLSIVD